MYTSNRSDYTYYDNLYGEMIATNFAVVENIIWPEAIRIVAHLGDLS